MIAALIAALSNGVSLVTDKVTLSKKKTPLKLYIATLFIFLFVFTVIFYPKYGRVDWVLALMPNFMFLLLLLVIVSIIQNIFYYDSIQKEPISQHEMIMMSQPLVTILMASAFFPETFDLKIFILSIVASVSLMVGKLEKRHITFTRTSYNLILAVVLIAIQNIISKELLYIYSPVALYAIRVFFLAIFFMIYYRPVYSMLKENNRFWYIGLSAAFAAVYMIASLYSFDKVGIVYTTLISTLTPIVVFLASWEILHERIKTRLVFASIIILICSVWATFLQFYQ